MYVHAREAAAESCVLERSSLARSADGGDTEKTVRPTLLGQRHERARETASAHSPPRSASVLIRLLSNSLRYCSTNGWVDDAAGSLLAARLVAPGVAPCIQPYCTLRTPPQLQPVLGLTVCESDRRRGEKRPIPAELKDEKYFERRRRNNQAAKKSRDARRMREDQIAWRACLLEQENASLRAHVAALRQEALALRGLLAARDAAPTPARPSAPAPAPTSTTPD